MDEIRRLVDRLFEKAAYSKQIEKAKNQIAKALVSQYDLYAKDHNEIEAMGLLMSEFGTLEKAGVHAGFTEDEIKSWENNSDLIDAVRFQKVFKRQRWTAYLLSLFMLLTMETLMFVFVYGKLIHYIFAFLCVGATAFLAFAFYRIKRKVSFSKDAYKSDARDEINRNYDRYAKRLLNSVYCLIAGFFIEVYLFLTSIIRMNMSPSEAFLSQFSSSVPIGIMAYILMKNMLCKSLVNEQYSGDFLGKYGKYSRKSVIVSVVYWVCSIGIILLLKDVLKMPIELMYLTIIVYFILVISANLSVRSQIVFTNIHVNIKRIFVIGLAAFSLISYQVMKINTYILLPYISMIQEIPREKDEIFYNDQNGVYTITTSKEDFKVLQLTDIHLGGSAASVMKDYQALKACKELIEKTKPDFVVVTGDLSFPLGIMSFSFNNTTPIIEFANFMRNIGVPWAFTYGNHDTERVASGSVEEVIQTFKSLSYRSSGNLLYPYIQPDITGRNNQLIEIRNEDGSLRQALFLLDSNDYVDGVNDYDYIHDDQVEWYRSQLERLKVKEGKTVSSMLFFHIPLQQYRTANALYEAGSDEVTYFMGENKEKVDGKVCCSRYPSKLFDTAKELGSTKAMFCGHDHYNNLSVEYQGIRLTYGMSIDYLAMPGIDQDKDQRGATLITLHRDSDYEIEQVPYRK